MRIPRIEYSRLKVAVLLGHLFALDGNALASCQRGAEAEERNGKLRIEDSRLQVAVLLGHRRAIDVDGHGPAQRGTEVVESVRIPRIEYSRLQVAVLLGHLFALEGDLLGRGHFVAEADERLCRLRITKHRLNITPQFLPRRTRQIAAQPVARRIFCANSLRAKERWITAASRWCCDWLLNAAVVAGSRTGGCRIM